MPSKLIGTAPSQVPLNSYLGSVAFQDKESVNITGGAIGLNASNTTGYFVNTDISEVKPSLLLDFANGKQMDPRVTFTRGSTGTYFGGSSVKAEENQLLDTKTFSSWSKAQCILMNNAGVAPDGTNTASLWIANTNTAEHYITCSRTLFDGQQYTYSVYAKPAGKNWIILNHNNYTGSTYTYFNISTGTVGTTGPGVTASIISAGNGWYRCMVSITHSTSAHGTTGTQLYIGNDTGTASSFAGDGASGIYIWGAQLEQRSGASSYVSTTSTPAVNYQPLLQTAGANVPRFDHDPYTGESKGLLIEEQRTNLVTSSAYGENYFTAVSYAFVTPNQTIAPDGMLTAAKLGVSSSAIGSNYQPRYQMLNSPGGAGQWTLSCFAKAGEWNYLALSIFATSNYQSATFDLVTQQVTNVSGLDSYSITPIGNGWYRLAITATTGGTINQNPTGFWPSPDGQTAGYNTGVYPSSMSGTTFNGFNGVYIWGLQFEAGAYASSYIPTVSAQVTRTADYTALIGQNFSSWWRADEQTYYVEAEQMTPLLYGRLIDISYGNSQRYSMYRQLGTGRNGINSQIQLVGDAWSTGTYAKFACSFSPTGMNSSFNGNTQTNTGAFVPFTADRMNIGQQSDGYGVWNGHVKKIAFYPKRLSASELQEMTL